MPTFKLSFCSVLDVSGPGPGIKKGHQDPRPRAHYHSYTKTTHRVRSRGPRAV
ncbi:unnamed protein product [Sphenostylis stenocarpa]|uniref:Uncharacterized protein n=1 Tax=Sphenostylis stenocarpa TaxID=92480 RepID=A0AA86SIL2_9FABA|nr:unnamed protein product [Sphenostylis stenocarpa]